VADSTGALVPGATITVASTASGAETTVLTNDQGYYSIPSLPPGVYNLMVSRTGFQAIHSNGLTLSVQQVARLDFNLQIGAVSETVEVRAQSVVLESETATTGQVVQSNKSPNSLCSAATPTPWPCSCLASVRRLESITWVIDQISTVSYVINASAPATTSSSSMAHLTPPRRKTSL